MLEQLANIYGLDDALERARLRDWLQFSKWLNKKGLLFCMLPEIERVAPELLVSSLYDVYKLHVDRLKRRLEAVKEFKRSADDENLHFALIKGMATSKILYGNEFARQSGDIDIIVDHDDIPKADYVARKAGWLQPAEAFRVRKAISQERLQFDSLRQLQAPYPLRSSPFLPHVSNYYYGHESGQIDALEIHDCFYGLRRTQVAALLSDLHFIELDKTKYATVSNTAHMLLSLLSLHEDSESVRVNTSNSGECGLKACLDVRKWIEVLDDNNLREVLRMAKSLNCEQQIAEAFYNCASLFPDIAESLPSVLKRAPNRWTKPYESRVRNPNCPYRLEVKDGLSAAFRAFEVRKDLACYGDGHWHAINAFGQQISSGFQFRLYKGDSKVIMSWSVSQYYASSPENLALQVLLLCMQSDNQIRAVRVEAYNAEGKWQGLTNAIAQGSFDSHAGTRFGDYVPNVQMMPNGQGGIKVEVELDVSKYFSDPIYINALPSAHVRNCKSIFRIIAGMTLVDLVESCFA